MSEEIATAIADRAGEVATIRARWADRQWRLILEDDGSHAVIETNSYLGWTMDVPEPFKEEVAFLETAVHAPADIRALLARLDSAHALLKDIRIFLDSRPARTPLIERLITAIVAELA